jgi:hypothetical protein
MGPFHLPLQNRRASADTADVPESFKGFYKRARSSGAFSMKNFLLNSWFLLLPALWGHDYQCGQCWQCWPAYAGRANYNATSSGEVSP